MAARLSAAEANEILKNDDHKAHHDVLKRLPEDVDPGLAAGLLVEALEKREYWFARNLRKHIPSPVILEVSRMLESVVDTVEMRFKRDSLVLLERLRLRSSEEDIQDAWSGALQIMLDINTSYGWGSKQRKAKLRGLSEDSLVVATLRAVAVGCESPPMDVLVVLALEGSDEAMDALLPHFSTSDLGRRLERLERLRTHIPKDGSAADLLLSDIETQLAERRDESPAFDFAEQLGFGRPKAFWFRYDLGTVERSPNGYNPRFRFIAEVDSRDNDWFSVSVYEVEANRRTRFGDRTVVVDELGLGTSELEKLPDWLATIAKKLQCEWGDSHISSSLRGKKRADLVRWFESAIHSPTPS
jgi:hypothetical protein